ncbi:MBL fold metallo-hydrolase [soil metagenome]
MEITWFGERCLRLRGREGTIVADGYRTVVGPTGRGLTADIVTYSHPETPESPNMRAATDQRSGARKENGDGPATVRPTSLEPALLLDRPGEYEAHNVMITGVRTFRDESKGIDRGPNVSFVYELDGLHAIHLGDIAHLLTEEMLGEISSVDVVCVPIGGALSASRAAELVAQLDANLIVPMPVSREGDGAGEAMDRFLHEMGVQHPDPQPKLTVTISSIPQETTLVVLDSRSKVS